jgi:hypothetical protein
MYEQASERWSPVQSVEKVLLSVISMLAGMSPFPIPKCDSALMLIPFSLTNTYQNRTLRVERTLTAASSTGTTMQFVL